MFSVLVMHKSIGVLVRVERFNARSVVRVPADAIVPVNPWDASSDYSHCLVISVPVLSQFLVEGKM